MWNKRTKILRAWGIVTGEGTILLAFIYPTKACADQQLIMRYPIDTSFRIERIELKVVKK
jgi:hypothetical protein